MYKRALDLQKLRSSFFLWGPRQVGKSSLLKSSLKDSLVIDLLKSEIVMRFREEPSRLRQEILALKKKPSWIIIDEIQKVPSLLDEVHFLIEAGYRFALCGSSARKVKKGHANLLGGRALRRELHGLSGFEMANDFNLTRVLNRGTLPNHYLHSDFRDRLSSYCADYLKEEILAEGLVRNLPAFSSFLKVASFSDAETVDFANIAREIGVSSPTIKSYFEILEDTLIGTFLQAYRRRAKRRTQTSPKFYFFDVGVSNFLARRGSITIGSELAGKAFENWVFHELNCYRAYRDRELEITFWRLSTGAEVDFILNDMEVAIEAKCTAKVHDGHLKGLIEIKREHPKLKKRIVVANEQTLRRTSHGIDIMPVADFLESLWAGKIV